MRSLKEFIKELIDFFVPFFNFLLKLLLLFLNFLWSMVGLACEALLRLRLFVCSRRGTMGRFTGRASSMRWGGQFVASFLFHNARDKVLLILFHTLLRVFLLDVTHLLHANFLKVIIK